jgi:hypothetical protein
MFCFTNAKNIQQRHVFLYYSTLSGNVLKKKNTPFALKTEAKKRLRLSIEINLLLLSFLLEKA